MLNISGLKEGIVLDHIEAGKSLDIYYHLGLDKLDCQVAIIKNARSNKMGRKDIIKIEGGLDKVDLDILGYIDHTITVNIIKDDHIAEKKALKLPKKITNVIHCKILAALPLLSRNCLISSISAMRRQRHTAASTVKKSTAISNKVYNCPHLSVGDFLLYRKDRRRRSFELKMPAGRRATQIDDLGIKKDKNLPHQILHQDRHHLENNPYPAGLPRSYGECPWK